MPLTDYTGSAAVGAYVLVSACAVVATVAASWFVLWKCILTKLPFIQELCGIGEASYMYLAALQLALVAEIAFLAFACRQRTNEASDASMFFQRYACSGTILHPRLPSPTAATQCNAACSL